MTTAFVILLLAFFGFAWWCRLRMGAMSRASQEMALRLQEAVEATSQAQQEGASLARQLADEQARGVFFQEEMCARDGVFGQCLRTFSGALLSLRMDGVILSGIGALHEILERPEDDLIGKSLFDFITQEEHSRLRDLLHGQADELPGLGVQQKEGIRTYLCSRISCQVNAQQGVMVALLDSRKITHIQTRTCRFHHLLFDGKPDNEPALMEVIREVDRILGDQLEGVIQETEQAAGAIFDKTTRVEQKMQAMIGFLHQAHGRVSGIADSSRKNDGAKGDMIADMRSFIDGLESKRKEEGAKVAASVAQVRALERLVRMVLSISEKINVLALNASIVAARSGEHGLRFAVVAQEVRTLAEQTGRVARDIEERIQSAADAVEEVFSQRFSTEHSAQEEAMLQQATGRIDQLGRHYGELLSFSESTMRQVTQWNQDVSGDLSALVAGIQFQDIVRQRIEQVIHALHRRSEHIGRMVVAVNDPAAPKIEPFRASDMMSDYVMEKQRATHRDGISHSAVPVEEDIVLF